MEASDVFPVRGICSHEEPTGLIVHPVYGPFCHHTQSKTKIIMPDGWRKPNDWIRLVLKDGTFTYEHDICPNIYKKFNLDELDGQISYFYAIHAKNVQDSVTRDNMTRLFLRHNVCICYLFELQSNNL